MSHDNIEFILVDPSHPGNVGAAARAIGTMGFRNLSLVNPVKHPHPESRARSSGALDILLNAKVFETLDEAIADSSLVIGTTARQRRISVPIDSIHESTESIFKSSLSKKYQLFLVLRPQVFQMMISIVVTALFTFQLEKCIPL